MQEISLSPYPGRILLTRDFEEFKRHYKKLIGEPYTRTKTPGTTARLDGHRFLVHAARDKNNNTLAHELSHVILDTFDLIGSDPRGGNGEPFCYMLSHLLESVR